MESYNIEEILNHIIKEAVLSRASDIHFDPTENALVVSFRIDGWLCLHKELDKSLHEGILFRIKVLARLPLDERRLPKDGRFVWEDKDSSIEIRVSMVPTLFGENAVLRLFDQNIGEVNLLELGFSEKQIISLEKILEMESGIIMVVGPTGSGKTTTLYSLLTLLKKSSRLIITIEDPIERRIKGIRQIEVGGNTLLDFPMILRSVLRQDPDIIMVGEIRDNVSADLALQAGLSGHLVLATLHASSVDGARNRLVNMGVSSYLLDSIQMSVIAQKLVSEKGVEGRKLICELSHE